MVRPCIDAFIVAETLHDIENPAVVLVVNVRVACEHRNRRLSLVAGDGVRGCRRGGVGHRPVIDIVSRQR